jgi:hypothetical protein
MKLRTARALTGLYILLATVAVVWPGALVSARIRPFILGLPFAFAWPARWVAGSLVVLYLVDRVERRHRGEG